MGDSLALGAHLGGSRTRLPINNSDSIVPRKFLREGMNQLGPRAGDLRTRELRTQRALMSVVKSCVLLTDAGGVLNEDSHELF
jgi:hypothetical protein